MSGEIDKKDARKRGRGPKKEQKEKKGKEKKSGQHERREEQPEAIYPGEERNKFPKFPPRPQIMPYVLVRDRSDNEYACRVFDLVRDSGTLREEEKNLLVWVKDGVSNEFLCFPNALRDRKTLSLEEKKHSVADALSILSELEKK